MIYRRHGRQASPFPVLLPNSFPLNSFADPHPLNPVASILYENMGGGGAVSPFQLLISKPLTSQNCFKSFSCNTYRSPRKCCKQKTYGRPNSFRCNTYKKQGGTSFKPKVLLSAPLSRRSETQIFGRFNGQASRRVSGLPPIFRTLFQVPYPAIPLFATLTKTAGSHPSSQRFFSFLAGLFLFSFHSLYQKHFRTPSPPKGSALFLKTAGCHPTISILELPLCVRQPHSLLPIPYPLSIPRLVVSCG